MFAGRGRGYLFDMARPPKNSCDYFPHDAGMRDHRKVKAIRTKFGITGYAIWSMMLEYLTARDGNVFPYTDLEFTLMSGDFGVSVTEIRDVVDFCISLEMLFNKDGFVSSESLDERLAPVYAKRGRAKELSKQQLRSNGKFCNNNTEATVVSVTEKPQSKVKEIKVEESKNKNDLEAIASHPQKKIEDKVLVFKESLFQLSETNGGKYPPDMIDNFFNYWSELNKSRTKMRWQFEQTFEVEKRLATWAKRDKSFNSKFETEQQTNKYQGLKRF